MNKLFAALLFASGILLIVFGLDGSNSIRTDFSRLFAGSVPDKAMWLFIAGVIATLVGAGGLIRGTRST
jgi:hypothetical protein